MPHNLMEAQFNLGCLYADGKGVPVSHFRARKFWEKAASQVGMVLGLGLGLGLASSQVLGEGRVAGGYGACSTQLVVWMVSTPLDEN